MNISLPEFWELLAATFGVLSVILSAKANIWVFPTGMVSVFIYIIICYRFGIYADMGVNAYYFLMSIYGWYHWSRGNGKEKNRPILRSDKPLKLKALILFLFSFSVLYYILENYSDSSIPLADAFTTAMAISAMWLMALKRIEHWYLWIVTDLLSIWLYHYKGLDFTAIQFFLFTLIAIYGLVDWRKKLQAND